MFQIPNVWDLGFPAPSLILPLPLGGGGYRWERGI